MSTSLERRRCLDRIEWSYRAPRHGVGIRYNIVNLSQGFVVGEGAHNIRGKSVSGCWCVPTLSNVCLRADPTRYTFRGDFTRFCCPAVLEIQSVSLRHIPGTTTHVAPYPVGEVHTGLSLRAVHFNKNWCRHFMQLEDLFDRSALATDPFHCRRCACGLCGLVRLPSDPSYWEWRKSRSGKYYPPRCYDRTLSHGVYFWAALSP